MSAAIGPGDMVECFDPSAPDWALGRTFRVRNVVLACDPCFDCGDNPVAVEIDDGRCDLDNAYCTGCQVRLVGRPRSTLIESLKQLAPDREPEHI